MAKGSHRPPVDRGWAWVVLLASWTHSALAAISYLSGVYTVIFLETFNQSVALTTWCSSLHASILSLSGPLTSLLIKLIGARLTSLIGAALVFIGFLVPSLVASFPVIFFFYGIVAGFGYGLSYLPFMVWTGFHFKKRRKIAFGCVTTAAGFGAFFLSPFMHYLIQEYGWQGSMTLAAGLMAHMFVCGAVLRPIDFEIIDSNNEDEEPLPKDQEQIIENPLDRRESMSLPHVNVPDTTDGYRGSGHVEVISKINLKTKEINSGKSMKSYSSYHLDESKNLTSSQPNLSKNNGQNSNIFFSVGNVNSTADENREVSLNSVLKNRHVKKLAPLKPQHQVSSEAITRSMISLNNPWVNYTDSAEGNSKSAPRTEQPENLSKWKEFIHEYRSLASRKFLLYCANLLFVDIGLAIGYIYLPALAQDNGSSAFQAAQLISVVGITNIIARLLTGVATSSQDINTYTVYMSTCGIMGIIFFFTPLISTTFAGQVVLAASFGLYGNVFSAMMTPITIDIVGLSFLNVAHGAELLLCGIGMMIGPPIAGIIYAINGSFNSVMVFAGTCYFAGSLVIMLMPVTSNEAVYL